MASDEKKLQAIRHNLYYQGLGNYTQEELDKILDVVTRDLDMCTLLELCNDEKRFRLLAFHAKVAIERGSGISQPSLSDEVNDLILQLELDRLGAKAHSREQWRQRLRGHLTTLQQNRYRSEYLASVLDKLLNSSSFIEKIYEALDLCTNEKKFRLCVFYANVTAEENTMETQTSLPDATENLILRLDLDAVECAVQRNLVVRKYMTIMHKEKYGVYLMEKVLDKIFDSPKRSKNLSYLLEFCINEEKFHTFAFLIKMAIERGEDSPFFGLSEELEERNLQKIDMGKPGVQIQSTEEFEQAVRKHLTAMHNRRYGMENLAKLLDKAFQSTSFPRTISNLIDLCANEKRFRVLVFHVKVALEKQSYIEKYGVSTDVKDANLELPRLSEEEEDNILLLNLDGWNSREEWKEAIRKHLESMYRDRYGEEKLQNAVEYVLHEECRLGAYSLLKLSTKRMSSSYLSDYDKKSS